MARTADLGVALVVDEDAVLAQIATIGTGERSTAWTMARTVDGHPPMAPSGVADHS